MDNRRANPQRWRIGAWLALGDGVLLAGGAALCALPLLAWALLPGAAALAGVALTLPALVSGVIMLRTPFSAAPDTREEGLPLRRDDAPGLFEALDGIRDAMAAPPLDAIYLDGEFNAAIRQHRRLGGKTRNVLWLGLPLLDMLSPSACRAILAHEYAHIAQRHGRYASRVYFARLQWQEVARRLDRRRRLSSAPLRLFVAWYVPRFLAVSLDFARQCEVQADAEAARVCGQPAMAEALSAMALQWRALRDAWPALLAASDPPRPYAALAARDALAAPADEAEARVWLHAALCATTADGDTHPSLADRLAALAADPARPLPWRRAAPTAAQAWLSGQRASLAARLDACCAAQSADEAAQVRQEREALTAQYHDLLRKRRIRALSADETARCAWLRGTLDDDVAGAALLAEDGLRLAPGHPALLAQLARCRQREGHPREAADLWLRVADHAGPEQLPSLRQLSLAALRAGDHALAEDYRRRADALQQSPPRADAADGYHPHDLSPAELGKLADTLDPLLRIATGTWLLRPAAGGRYRLLVLAREAALLRLIGRLTGEPSYLRRDCEQLLGRLLPRLRLDVEADIMAAGDPRLAWCVEQARVRRPA
ncbi:M48 family metallopeptidase [Achromobacter ruhlandii]|uniref:M48 family metallopeptidase n=1 Tax=Achromobacter ruhlandii TaxID=72557 RepID=UPI0006C27CC3|nr:M48 family metallopeptidase [Achromobacter ruhlandii]AMG44869.1 peptidase M48 [Achromobacter xylosoxidans]CUI28304.1 Peptidase family M48 [Achromobacter ruhlandii]CUI36277.1 Peptidase family M48 [Achromobacter ruhlandii]CUJ95218.1 Peptidase family M48 [Achromobacter ruhlandii]